MANLDFTELFVHLPTHDYPILIGHGLLRDKTMLRRYVFSEQVMVVSNTTVAPLYLHQLQAAFADRQCDVVVLEDGEVYKNQQSLFQIYDALLAKQHHRDTTLVALGGGVVGDITGFAAATYQRGVNLVQIPTTLLAQVDAAVGGKTAINHPQGKNMIGSFYQPNAVIIELATLQTLGLREFHAGFAEIIKYAILVGGDFLKLIQKTLTAGFHSTSEQLPAIISQCCHIKASFIQEDAHEHGSRALLNLGHTIAHALEAYTQYNRWLHGEAVAIGLYCAALLSYRRGCLNEQTLTAIDALLLLAKLPRRIPQDINLERLRTMMAKDKKIKNNTLRFVLIKSMGNCYLDDNVTELDLQTVMFAAVEGRA